MKSERRTQETFNRAVALLERGNAEGAAQQLETVLRLAPEHADANCLRGVIAFQKNDLNSAKKYFQTALTDNPELAEAHNNLGSVLTIEENYQEAADHYSEAIRIQPDFARAYVNRGLLHETQGEFAKAEEYFRQAIRVKPDYASAYDALSIALQRRRAFEAAIENSERAVTLDPNNAQAQNNLGVAYLELTRAGEAEACFRKALDLNRDFVDARRNLGSALQDQGFIDAGEVCFRDVLLVKPDDIEARYRLATSKLARGEFAAGWPDYILRWQRGQYQARHFPFPQWSGEPLNKKTILLIAEQGLGEDIMFASCLPDLLGQAAQAVIECDKRLLPIFSRSFPQCKIMGTKNEQMPLLTDIDCYAAMGDLPNYFRRHIHEFPNHNGYLFADQNRIDFWRNELSKLGSGLKIGFSWRGGIQQTRRTARSISPEFWKKLFELPSVHLINLQYDSTEQEVVEIEQRFGYRLRHFPRALENYDETAALVSALDVVVSVCTAVIHLAGALGKRTFVMVPRVPSWRYLRYGQRMPWYPSVTLLRQTAHDQWESVVEQATRHIAKGHF